MVSRIIVVGEAEFHGAMKLKTEASNRASRNIVAKGGEIISANAKKEFRPYIFGSQRVSASGKTYYKTAPPFQPIPPRPTNRSGNLQRSIRVALVSTTTSGVWMSETGPAYGPATRYAKYVEVGGNRKFPYMEPGFDKSLEELRLLAQEEWRIATEA
jgi:hypothetical protein